MNAEPEDHARIWFSYALGNLAAARNFLDAHTRSRIVAFWANRAAKDALTAALVLAEIDPPGTDILEGLRATLPSSWRAGHAQASHASAVLELIRQGFE